MAFKLNIKKKPEREFCKVCATRWMKELWSSSCVCSGHVNLVFTMPGPPSITYEKQQKPQLTEKPKVVRQVVAFKARKTSRAFKL